MYGCILFTGKTGQCSDIARGEREAEPGEACWGMLSAHSEVSKLWEATKTGSGGVGRVPGLAERSRDTHGLVRSSCSLLSVRGWLVNFSAGS